MSSKYKLLHRSKIIRDYLNENVRPDGREYDMYRPLGINAGSLTESIGSSIVKLGNTTIICGVRAELAKPRADAPGKGFLIPNVETSFVPSTNRSLNDFADTINSLLLNILTESDCISLEKLCVHDSKLVWALYCDIICLEQDGCILDGAIMACLAAFKQLELPIVIYDAAINKITISAEKTKLEVKNYPIVSTYALLEDFLLSDPTFEEETLSSAVINIGLSNGKVRFLLKSGGKPINKKILNLCLAQTIKREAEVLKLFENLV